MTLLASFKRVLPQKSKNIYHYLNAAFAVLWYGFPTRNLFVIGVTGTDGKTTTATLIYYILKSAGKKAALVSTVAAYIGNQKIDTGFHVTNPNPWPLQKLLKRIASSGYKYIVLEVTSHGLDQHRTLGTNIKIAVLTNITHEHLDYHKTYKNYARAKGKIFKDAKIAILNKTDRSYPLVKKYIRRRTEVVPYDFNSVPKDVVAAIRRRFPENYNQLNALAAYSTVLRVGVSTSDFKKSLRSFPGVSGRMEEIENDRGFRIIVDFAHTPNALESVLTSLKKQTKGRLIAVFGCASERDEAKRPMMGQISANLADISVFTAEDPRREDVQKIIKEIAKGAERNKRPNKYYEIPERGEAIYFAINEAAKAKDVVVICGKGHEGSMNYNGIEYPWSDKEAVLLALKGKKKLIKR